MELFVTGEGWVADEVLPLASSGGEGWAEAAKLVPLLAGVA